jgi:hypothetical protein
MSTAPTDAPTSGSGAASNFDLRLPQVKLDNIEILTGHDNYEDWAEQVTIVLDAMQLSEIVIEGSTLPDDASATEKAVAKARKSQALLLLIQVLSKPIIKLVAKKRDPHLIWAYLKESYHRDTAFSFVQQIMNFTSLPSTYDPSEPLGTFIDKFETEWARLQSLTTGSTTSDTYRTKFREFLEDDKAKRDFLLGFLVKHHENVVDNLTTKDSLSYSDVVQKLHSLSSNAESSSSVAYKANQHSGKKNNTDFTKRNTPANSKKECTYCKAHKLGTYTGHVWNDCRQLKAKQEAEKKETANVAQEETLHHALNAVSDPSVAYTWIFDTGASSHMTFNKGLFHSLSDYHGYVKVGGGRRLRALWYTLCIGSG